MLMTGACFSSWLSGPRGRLGAAQSKSLELNGLVSHSPYSDSDGGGVMATGLGPNNRAEKEGEEEMQSSVSGPFFGEGSS